MNFQSFVTEDLKDQGYKLSKSSLASGNMKKIGRCMDEVRKLFDDIKDSNLKKALEFLNKAYENAIKNK